MRVVVTGGRKYDAQSVVWGALTAVDDEFGIDLLGHGACHLGGADILAENWAKYYQVPYLGIPAKWRKYGRSAGMKRNGRMLDLIKPELVLAFPGGTGTLGCIKEAEKRKIKVERHGVWA